MAFEGLGKHSSEGPQASSPLCGPRTCCPLLTVLVAGPQFPHLCGMRNNHPCCRLTSPIPYLTRFSSNENPFKTRQWSSGLRTIGIEWQIQGCQSPPGHRPPVLHTDVIIREVSYFVFREIRGVGWESQLCLPLAVAQGPWS